MINEELSRKTFDALWGRDNNPIGIATTGGRLSRDTQLVVMTSGDSLELQSILTELKGLLDEVLRIMFGPSNEQVPLALGEDGPAIIDNLVAAINDAAINVLQALDLTDTNSFGGSFAEGNTNSRGSTALRLPGALPISEEALRTCIGGPELPGLDTLVSLMSLTPNRADEPAEMTGDNLAPEPAQGHRRLSHFDRHRLGWASLTNAEQRVAELVALGLSNRQVSQHMFLSRGIIEDHLQHVFVKLGITSRVELGRYALIWSMLP